MKRIFLFTLALLLCFSCIMFVSSSSAATYSTVDEALASIDAYDGYVVYERDGNKTIHVWHDYNDYSTSNNAEFTIIANDNNYLFLYLRSSGTDFKFNFHTFVTNSEGNLHYNGNRLTNWADVGHTIDYVYKYSSIDILNNDGTVFFQHTPQKVLHQIIQEIATTELQIQNQTLVGTMRILTVCGVGLIALLIGLVLFGKLFRIFHLK